MEELGMPPKQTCVICYAGDCTAGKQSDFDGLQVNSADRHDQTLVEARMLGVASSAGSMQTKAKSSGISTKKQSDYWLKRFMASFDKLSTFLRRCPRAATHMQASESHALASTLEPSARSNSY